MCSERFDGVALFVTRYEWKNLFHQITDLFNTFLVRGQPPRAFGLLLAE